MKLEIKDVIAEEMAKAKEYKAQANFGWDYMTHKRLSNMERERSLYFAERHKQIAKWLHEFAEMRKGE